MYCAVSAVSGTAQYIGDRPLADVDRRTLRGIGLGLAEHFVRDRGDVALAEQQVAD